MPSLDPSILNNFRPISKLPFLAKVLDEIVAGSCRQLISHPNGNILFDKFDKRVLKDILLAAENSQTFVLDLMAAFDI